MQLEHNWVEELRKKAMQLYPSLPLPPGEFVDPVAYEGKGKQIKEIKSVSDAPPEVRNVFEKLGISESEQKYLLGLSVQADNNIIYKKALDTLSKHGIIVEGMNSAVSKYPWLKDYFFNLIPYDRDKLTAYHAAHWNNGVLVWAKGQYDTPVHAYFMLMSPLFSQMEHTIVIAEPNSRVNIVEGCTAPVIQSSAVHLGVNEIYVKQNAQVSLTKLQNWPEYVHTRPITRIRVEAGGSVRIMNILFGGGASTIERPQIDLVGPGASATVQTIVLASKKTKIYGGTLVKSKAPNTTILLQSKTLGLDMAEVKVLDKIVAENTCKGHISCDALLLGKSAQIDTSPALFAKHKGAILTHEASIGKLDAESLFYLMTRGLSEDKAKALLIQGFVAPLLKQVPLHYQHEVSRLIELLSKQGF